MGSLLHKASGFKFSSKRSEILLILLVLFNFIVCNQARI